MKTIFNSKRFLSLCIAFMMILGMLPITTLTAIAAGTELSDDIVILYTNDVHTYIDGPLSYDVISALKADLQEEYNYVLLADAGDHIQGTAYGSMDKGESIIKLMNAAGYDVATLGNHEFDYTMSGCMNVLEWAEYSYISCNFYREADGVRTDNVLDSYVIFDCGDEKIAFVGITTPETFTKSTPTYFQDENGNFIYGISGGEDGSELRQDVQTAINDAKNDGATQVIALGHLGVDESSSPWTSEETIAGVSGLDAFIDGHSHTIIEGKDVKDKDGNDVLLTQTGEYFNRIGMMVIDSETGEITTDFIECVGSEETGYTLTSELYSGTVIPSDAAVKSIKDGWMQAIDEQLGQKIGSTTVVFDNYDSEGNRLVRGQETNSGDFAADALYYLFDNMGLDVDIAIMNGGGVRNKALTGDITYKTCKDVHPFGNVACLQTVTGQQILDMLEWGARNVGESENGSFLHVSGITYKVNTTIPNTTQADDMDIWLSGPSEYRVHDVMVYNKSTDSWNALDLTAQYNLAGYNYTLRDLGGGFAMLDGAVNVLDYVMEDYMVLANYIKGFENGIIGASNSPLLAKYPGLLIDYGTVYGSGRIAVATTGEAHEHTYEDWTTDGTICTRTCTVDGCSATETHATVWGEWHYQPSVHYRFCTCGCSTTAKQEHTPQITIVFNGPDTITYNQENGYPETLAFTVTASCEVEACSFGGTGTVNATLKESTAPTCSSEGTATYEASYGGQQNTASYSVSALGHKDENTDNKCDICNEKISTENPTSPETGDNSRIFLWIALLFVSGGAVITLTIVEKKQLRDKTK